MDIEKYNGEIFNVGGGDKNNFSLLELTQECENITGQSVEITKDKVLRQGDIKWYISDIAKVSSAFNCLPKKSFQETVEEIAKWIIDNKEDLCNIL